MYTSHVVTKIEEIFWNFKMKKNTKFHSLESLVSILSTIRIGDTLYFYMFTFKSFCSLPGRSTYCIRFYSRLSIIIIVQKYTWTFFLKKNISFALINLVMRYVTSVSCSVMINGEASPWFVPRRWLRQGDPLPLSIYPMCWSVFMFTKRCSDKQFYSWCQGGL